MSASSSRPRTFGQRGPTTAYTDSFGFQWRRFARTQLDSANGTHRSRDAFVAKTGWRLEDLRGLRLLDAGCGMGRFAEVCADAGAEVLAIDLSGAAFVAHENLKTRENVHVCQADVMALPFADGSFDRIYSIGVLHHTPDTRLAFLALTRLLRPGGEIAIWVYGTGSPGGGWLRGLTRRLPRELLFKLCWLAAPAYHLYRVPLIGRVLYRIAPISMEKDPDWRWLDTFDWYSPRYQWKHTLPEVEAWFRSAGLTNVVPAELPVSVRGQETAG